jgi:hypothetical protein
LIKLEKLGHNFKNGKIHPDNNSMENKIRPIKLGQKTYLYNWMTYTLNMIGNHPVNKLSELLHVISINYKRYTGSDGK